MEIIHPIPNKIKATSSHEHNTTVKASGLGDRTAQRPSNKDILHFIEDPSNAILGEADTTFHPNFMSKEEADAAFNALDINNPKCEIKYQQWHHMPDKKSNSVLPLKRLKVAMADTDTDGWRPHYRFPVNNQSHHGVQSFATSPTVSLIRDKLIAATGIPFNHAVVLIYLDSKSCIGLHKDKTLDLDPKQPIASVSLGYERSYIIQNDIRQPTKAQEWKLTHGGLLLLGPKTNNSWYHTVPMITPDDPQYQEVSHRVSITFRVATTFINVNTNELRGQGASYNTEDWPIELSNKSSHVPYSSPESILKFWFGDEPHNTYRSSLWWHGVSPELDNVKDLRQCDNYISTHWKSILDVYLDKQINLFNDQHLLQSWTTLNNDMATQKYEQPKALVSLLILFDQFPRHVYRGSRQSLCFAKYAESIATYLLHKYPYSKSSPLLPMYRVFVYVALMHSETILYVSTSHYGVMELAQSFPDNSDMQSDLVRLGKICYQHYQVITRFGRYPHRNSLLGRKSTYEETMFLSNAPYKWMHNMNPNIKFLQRSSRAKKSYNANTDSKNDVPIKPLRLLVLHSNRQTGTSFRNKTRTTVEKILRKNVELIYGDAPDLYYPSGEAAVAAADSGLHSESVPNVGATKSWWNATDNPETMIYRGVERSLEYIEQLFTENEIDGILGFSQGGTLTGIVASIIQRMRDNKNVPLCMTNTERQLKFVVIISGFYCRDTRDGYKQLIDTTINVPSFHIWGETDSLVDPFRSEKLASQFTDKITIRHPGGHFVPNQWPVEKIHGWMLQFANLENVNKISSMVMEYVKTGNISKLQEITPKSKDGKDLANVFVLVAEHPNATPSKIMDLAVNYFNHDIISAITDMVSLHPKLMKHLVYLDTVHHPNSSSHNSEFRKMLVEVITNVLLFQYKKFVIKAVPYNPGEKPSEAIMYIPNVNATYKETYLVQSVAQQLGKMYNVFTNTTTDPIKHDDETKYKKQVNMQYKKMLSTLRGLLKPNKPIILDRPFKLRHKTIDDGMNTPYSDFILKPRAEPMEDSRPDQMAALYKFIIDKQSPSIPDGEVKEFEKGTLMATPARLDLCKQGSGRTNLNSLMSALSADADRQNPLVRHLLLGNNMCGNDLGTHIAKFIQSGKSQIRSWYIAGNDLTEEGIHPICESLKLDTFVQQLWLKRNPLHTNGAYRVANMLSANTTLSVLDLTNTAILDNGAMAILWNLPSNLQHLYMAANAITSMTCEILPHTIPNSNIHTLSLGCNRIGKKGAKHIATMLSNPNCPLRSLELSSCAIDPEGITYLANALATSKHPLVKLNLGLMKSTKDLGEVPNEVRSTGAIALANMLKVNCNLRYLDITYTNVEQDGISALAHAMMINKSLIKFNVEQFGIPHNELQRETIRASVDRNIHAMSNDDKKISDEYLDPPHLKDILSNYRVE